MLMLPVATSTGHIMGLSKRLLDPWRPEGKVSGENVEWIIPYDPTLPVDPRKTLSYHLEVLIHFTRIALGFLINPSIRY
jgi:hypothetical protein